MDPSVHTSGLQRSGGKRDATSYVMHRFWVVKEAVVINYTMGGHLMSLSSGRGRGDGGVPLP